MNLLKKQFLWHNNNNNNNDNLHLKCATADIYSFKFSDGAIKV